MVGRVKERAERCLREQLANGPRYGEHVIAAAAEVDVSERTLIAAAERLGVRCRRGEWWLPG
jgi:cytosine/adenosine deaminase-related metal-dependent hydrolase